MPHEIPCRCTIAKATGLLAERGRTKHIAYFDLPRGNLTTDAELIECAQQQGRIVISKDADFVQSFLITGKPRLLLISTGNIDNAGLEKILRENLSGIETAFASGRFVEITRDALVVHE